jgi:hypothetical protein
MSDLPAVAAETPRAELVARTAQSEAGQMLSQIMAVILDPNVPETRLDRLLALQKALVEDHRRMLFVEAKARMQPHLPQIDRNGKIVIYSKKVREEMDRAGGELPAGAQPIQETRYAKQDDILEAVLPILSEHGFTLNFSPGKTAEGRIKMVGELCHVGGHVQQVDMPDVQIDATGSKNNLQGLGSVKTYLMRYATILLLNIVTRDPRDGLDNDGANGAPIEGRAVISEAQYKTLADEITAQGGKTLDAVLRIFGIESLAGLPAARFDECVSRLYDRRAAAAKLKG